MKFKERKNKKLKLIKSIPIKGIQSIIMEMEKTISNIILSMRKFQKNNNIKKQCLTNTQYLYDIIKSNNINNVKVKAVFALSNNYDTDTSVFVGGHLILVLDNDVIIDPSYDIFSLKNISYFYNIKDLINTTNTTLSVNNKNKLKTIYRELMCNHCRFIKLAERINNGELIITDKIHYNNQADYIENIYNII
jgi:hypothetical protein